MFCARNLTLQEAYTAVLLQAVAWPGSSCEVKPSKKKLPLKKAAEESETHTNRPEKLSQEGAVLEKALLAAADALLEKAQQLDEWDQRWMVNSYCVMQHYQTCSQGAVMDTVLTMFLQMQTFTQ